MDFLTYKNVVEAYDRLKDSAVNTPLLTSPLLNERFRAQIFFKAENIQRTGSFKFRGAMNAISILKESGYDIHEKGLLACSSGNHAQGIAEAARLHGVRATIIMPSDAPEIKVTRTKRSGGDVIFYDRSKQDREALTSEYQKKTGAFLIHPYDNPHVIAGQGTCGLEIVAALDKRSLTPDEVLVCTGGGGLTAGIGLVMKKHFPETVLHTVEPVGFDDYARSLKSGKNEVNERKTGSVCDAILTPSPGGLSFNLMKDFAKDGLVVTDDEALMAVAFAFHELKLVVEPGGAVALAALLAGKLNVDGKVVVAILSGGNIMPETLQKAFLMYEGCRVFE